MQFQFTKAVKERAKLRLAFIAPAGGGKTYTALSIGSRLLSPGGRMAVLDTEHGSAAKYADLFDFDELQLTDFNPDTYVAAIRAAERAGYEVIVIDSLSHAWAGPGGALELVDEIKSKSRSGASYHGWREVTPKHHALVEAMLQSPAHIIGTMRSKMTHVVEGGTVKKLGLQPVQRDGLEYEFDVVADMEDVGHANRLTISKTRCIPLRGKVFENPGAELAAILTEWLKGADPSRPKPISPEQLGTVQKRVPFWWAAQGIDPARQKDKALAAWQDFLRQAYGVGTATNLSGAQAEDLIGRLPAAPPEKVAEKAEAVPSQPTGRPPTATEAVSVLTTVAANANKEVATAAPTEAATAAAVTEAQLEEIKRLMPAWLALNGPNPPGDQATQLAAWRAMLRDRWGVVSATRMNGSQADELLATLREAAASPTAAVFAPGAAPAGTAEAPQQPQQPQPTTTAA